MQLRRARFLSTACTTHHRASGMCERSSMTSLALVYSSQRRRDSRSIGLNDLLDDQRRFRGASELAAAFAGAGIAPGTVAAASCGSGVTACVLILAAACVGLDLALYPGSYSRWCALGRPVPTGG